MDSLGDASPNYQIDASTNSTASLSTTKGIHIFLTLLSSAMLAVPQRSASDEFASFIVSPSRISPFICGADILSTLLWLFHGWWSLGLGWQERAQLAIRQSAISGSAARQQYSKEQNIVLAVFCLVTLFPAIWLMGQEDIFWAKVWVLLFLTAYIVHACTDLLASYAPAPATSPDHLDPDANEADRLKVLLNIVDFVNCGAYACQMKAWVDIFGNLTEAALTKYSEKSVTVVVGLVIILAYLVSKFTPDKGRYRVLHGLWSLRRWGSSHNNTVVACAFVIFLILGLPFRPNSSTTLVSHQQSSLWPMIVSPLGTLSVVVLVVYTVSIMHTLVRKACGGEVTNRFEVPVQEEQSQLASRLSVIVVSPREWREILSISFALCNILFGILYYTYVHPA